MMEWILLRGNHSHAINTYTDMKLTKANLIKEIEKKISIHFDNRPTFDGLWLKGLEICIGNLGLRIQVFNIRRYKRLDSPKARGKGKI